MPSPYEPKPLPKNFGKSKVPDWYKIPRSGPYSLASATGEDLEKSKWIIKMNKLQQKFDNLANKWESQVYGQSVIPVESIAYKEIVDMGKPIIPMVLNRIKQNKHCRICWFIVLNQITGINPVPQQKIMGL